MRYDIFELHPEMTARQKAWRIGLLLVIVVLFARGGILGLLDRVSALWKKRP